jgi:hypothetical protein
MVPRCGVEDIGECTDSGGSGYNSSGFLHYLV